MGMNDALNGTPILVCFVTLYRVAMDSCLVFCIEYHKSLNLESRYSAPYVCFLGQKYTLFIDLVGLHAIAIVCLLRIMMMYSL